MTESQITKPDFFKHLESVGNLRRAFELQCLVANLCKKLNRFADRQLENVVNGSVVQAHFQHMRLKPFAFAFRAAHEKIAQKLHLNLFIAGARATLAPPAAGVERKGACGKSLRHRFRLRREQFTDPIKQTQIKNRS